MFYVEIIAAIIAAVLIAWAIQVFIIDPEICDREQHGWPCKGNGCHGCYHNLPDGTREYTYSYPYKRELEA